MMNITILDSLAIVNTFNFAFIFIRSITTIYKQNSSD